MNKKRRSFERGKAKAPSGVLKARLVQIGKSRGLRLPKWAIKKAGLSDSLLISVESSRVIITSAGNPEPRAGWAEAFKAAVAEHGNELTEEDREWLEAPLNSDWEEKEWVW